MLNAMWEAHPQTVRQFFALAANGLRMLAAPRSRL
jgi:hypothetical protein